MSPVDCSSGQEAPVPAELRRKAQDSVRACVTSAEAKEHASQGWVMPLVATAAVAAAACAPVAWPLLVAAGAGGAAAAAVGAALGQLGAVGAGLLSEAVIRAWGRLGSRSAAAGEADLRDALADELEAGLSSDTPAAAALRREVAGLLQGVDAVRVALTVTIEESAAGVREVLVRGLRELGREFTEFRWVADEINQQLAVIAEDVAHTAATSQLVVGRLQQTLVELALLRQEARNAYGYQAGRIPSAVLAGSSTAEERAGAPDAAGILVSAMCPYPGLAAFEPQDAERFFGRELLTATLVARAGELLARPGLLFVLGPSGSGKSSLLRAGLLPAVIGGDLPAPGSGAWPRDVMTPGRRPVLQLAALIASRAEMPAGALEADLRTDPTRIIAAIRQAMLASARRQADSPGLTQLASRLAGLEAARQLTEEVGPGSLTAERQAAASPRLVLIVDQFEEIFTLGADEDDRRIFIEALCAAAGVAASGIAARGPARGRVDAREAPALVVIGLRADFYARCTAYDALVPYLQDHQLVGPIDEAGLRDVIEKPAAAVGVVVDDALTEVLLGDLGLHARGDPASARAGQVSPARAASAVTDSYEAGRLALLSYALQQTWHNPEGLGMTVARYRGTGGIDGAVAQSADNVFHRLSPASRDALRRMLVRLVAFGEDGTPDTRRQVNLSELTGSEDDTQAATARAVLEDLVRARLVTARTDTVEITHETLLTAWPRLHRWLTEDREGLRVHRDLTDASRQWQDKGRDSSLLFRGTRLAVTRDWAARHGQDLNDEERAFLAASQHEQMRVTRLRKKVIAGLAVLALAAAGLAIWASIERLQAIAQRNAAYSGQLISESRNSANPTVSILLSVAAWRLDQSPDARYAMLAAAAHAVIPTGVLNDAIPAAVAFSPDGKTLAASDGDQLLLWDVATHRQIGAPFAGHTNLIDAVAFSPDGKILASGSIDNTVRLWDAATHRQIGSPLGGFTAGVSGLAFSPDGETLAAGSDDSTIRLWNVATHQQVVRTITAGQSRIFSLAFSPDGTTLAAGSRDRTVRLWNAHTGAVIGQPITAVLENTAGDTTVYSVAFSPDGRTLATGGGDSVIRLWQVPSGRRIGAPLTGHTGAVTSVAFSPDGTTLASGSADETVRLWDVATHTEIGGPLTGHTDVVNSVAFSPDGTTLASGSADETVRLWHVATSRLIRGPGDTDPVSSVAFSRNGAMLADASGNTIRLWDVATGHQIGRPLTGDTSGVWSVAFSPDGTLLASGSPDGTVLLWDVATGREIRDWMASPTDAPAGARVVWSVAFSPDGKLLATASWDAVGLWDVATGRQTGSLLTGPADLVFSVAFSPDGTMLASGNFRNTIRLWDVATGREIGPPLTGHTDRVNAVAFSPDSTMLASGSDDQTARLWDVATGQEIGPPLSGHTSAVNAVAFSPDGTMLASGSSDNTVRLWDTATRSEIGGPLTFAVGGEGIESLAFSPDSTTLAAGGDNGTVELWDVSYLKNTASYLCTLVGRSLTRTEWTAYVAPGPAYQNVCPDDAAAGGRMQHSVTIAGDGRRAR
jgi:WD40 repeat protein